MGRRGVARTRAYHTSRPAAPRSERRPRPPRMRKPTDRLPALDRRQLLKAVAGAALVGGAQRALGDAARAPETHAARAKKWSIAPENALPGTRHRLPARPAPHPPPPLRSPPPPRY